MTTYIAPKIIRVWWIITGLLVGLTPAIWVLQTNNPYTQGVLFFSTFWLAFIFITWLWYGRYAKRISGPGTMHLLEFC
jgi:membrane protein implicated in regulation of membrane protease activity